MYACGSFVRVSRIVIYREYISVPDRFRSRESRFRGDKNDFCYYSQMPFARASHGTFFQGGPQLFNPFSEDLVLQRCLRKQFPPEVYNEVSKDLKRFGQRVLEEIHELGRECDLQLPVLNQFSAWGVRIDELRTCEAWKKQRVISAEEGIVAIGYERKFHEWSRLYQLAKLYLYSPAAGLYTCPLAMTDGAAKTIQESQLHNSLLSTAHERLTTRDPEKFWTSGQWMTERKGGSDVGFGTETVAVPENEFYRLYGYKWFSSATDADMSLTLARIVNNDGTVKEGSSGLTLFYVETKDQTGALNNLQVVKLKNKLGTRQVPTAELLLDGTKAYKVSEDGRGVAGISNMLILTRIHNAAASVAAMRCVLRLARDYSQRRYAFGEKIGNYPLHMQTLSRMENEVRGSVLLLFEVAELLGKVENQVATDTEALLLRIMTPILKLYTAKQAVSVVSEGLEAFGGQGYLEDTGLPVMLRDAQVLPIWEGTTNILSLDILRSIAKTDGEVLKALLCYTEENLRDANHMDELKTACKLVHDSAKMITSFVKAHPDRLQIAARDLAYSIARTFIGALLLENASSKTAVKNDIISAKRWCELQDLCPLKTHDMFASYSNYGTHSDYELVMEGYEG